MLQWFALFAALSEKHLHKILNLYFKRMEILLSYRLF